MIVETQVHVFGDNFNKEGSNRDLTFLPRASHESITFGSAGLFMTAEDLARWCFALFEEYEKNRDKYPNMDSFIPRIAIYLEQYVASFNEGT